MSKKVAFILTLGYFVTQTLFSQWVAGPMLGPVELREAKIWVAVKNAADRLELRLGKAGEKQERKILPERFSHYEFHTAVFTLGGLEPATTYEYTISVAAPHEEPIEKKGKLTTKILFEWRGAAPDFSFLTGSCSYFNEAPYDRPGRPYGLDSSIFETMAAEKNAAFMLWLGDNWYTREADFHSNWGLWYRAWRDRSMPVLQKFWSSMGHIAIWDDHDYGPNDYGKSYHLKNTSREVFRHFWLNHSYGDGQQGIYSRYQYNDVDFFLLDDRWWRDFDGLPDSIGGKPNPEKRMFGRQQMEWLKEELRYSKKNPHISFRLIVTGSQVLNPASSWDKMRAFPFEYFDLMNFIREEKIEGVLFLTGDRHHSEVIKVQHDGLYPMYDVTCSPLSSGTHQFGGPEADNPYRVAGLDRYQNYGRVTITGKPGERRMNLAFKGVDGNELVTWNVDQRDLKIPPTK